MGKVIEKSAKPDFFAQGGKSNHMFGKGGSQTMPPGVSAQNTKPGPGGKFAEGGKGHMFGKGHANTAEPGVSGKNSQ